MYIRTGDMSGDDKFEYKCLSADLVNNLPNIILPDNSEGECYVVDSRQAFIYFNGNWYTV